MIYITLTIAMTVLSGVLLRRVMRLRRDLNEALTEIAYLEAELDTTIAIAKRLRESLINRFANVYGEYTSETEPHQKQLIYSHQENGIHYFDHV